MIFVVQRDFFLIIYFLPPQPEEDDSAWKIALVLPPTQTYVKSTERRHRNQKPTTWFLSLFLKAPQRIIGCTQQHGKCSMENGLAHKSRKLQLNICPLLFLLNKKKKCRIKGLQVKLHSVHDLSMCALHEASKVDLISPELYS